jgi:nitrogen fixation-related uncharacterized protein
VRVIPLVLFVLAVAGLTIWWQVYKFGDCKNVGHSTLYCVIDFGK